MEASAPALASPLQYLEAQARWRPIELLFWLATLLPFVLTPTYLVLASQIAVTALFAMSLDLILGYAGIVSLGHAAFWASPLDCSAISSVSSSRASVTSP
jgi:branched-chain amino acid transport system permease protein